MAWERRQTTSGLCMAWYMLAVFFWTLGGALESISTSLDVKIIFTQIEYIGFVNVAPIVLCFALSYTKYLRILPRYFWVIIWIIPIITLLMAWTNAWHGWLWSGFTPVKYLYNTYIFQRGPWFIIHMIYSFVLISSAVAMFWRNFSLSHSVFRFQFGLLILASFFPVAASLLYVSGFNPFPGLDLPPVSFLFTNLILALAISRFHLLDIVPVARTILIENLNDGMLVMDHLQRVLDINSAACKLLNLSPSCVGLPMRKVFANQPQMLEVLSDLLPERKEVVVSREAEEDDIVQRYIEMHIIPLQGAGNNDYGCLLVMRDISAFKRIQAELEEKSRQMEWLAITDGLTQLFNRRYAEQVLAGEIKRCDRYQIPLSIGSVDIDDFKRVNDSYGHACGDAVIVHVADILRSGTRSNDIVARVGGEEFLILFPNTSINEATVVMERLRAEITSIKVDCTQERVTVSGGLTAWCAGDQVPDVLRRADRLLYRAKDQGKNCILSG